MSKTRFDFGFFLSFPIGQRLKCNLLFKPEKYSIVKNMSSNALRVVPVVDGIGQCTAICVNSDKVFLARQDGTVAYYKISSISAQVMSIPTVELVRTFDTGSRKPVTCLVSAGLVLVATAADTAYTFLVDDSISTASVLQKNTYTVAIQETSNFVPFPPIAVSLGSSRKRLLIYAFNEKTKSYAQQGSEIPTGSDSILRLVWFNQWLIGASSRSYLSVNVEEKILRDIFPVDTTIAICVLKSSFEILLVGHDGLGIFMTLQSDGLSPAPRNTISINHTDASIGVIGSYLASISAQDGIVDVFSLTSNDTKLIQTINLPSSGLAAGSACSTAGGLPVVAGSVLYLLITVPFESQLKKLIENQKLEDALELVNYQFSPGIERDSALKKFHKQVGWKLIGQGEFSVGFVHLSLAGDLEDVEKVLTGNITDSKAREPMVGFLRGNRLSASPELLKKIDSLLIELLAECPEELIEFVQSGNCVLDLQDAKSALGKKSPGGLALILEQQGEVKQALEILLAVDPLPATEVTEMLNRNVEKLDMHSLALAMGKLINSEVAVERLVALVTRSTEPLTLIDSIPILGDNPRGKEIEQKVLLSVSDTSKTALDRLLKLAVENDDSATVELLIKRHKLTTVQGLKSEFAKMMLLANDNKFRQAFVLHADMGERLIDLYDSEMPRSQLLLLLLAVLFETNQHESAVEVLLRNEEQLVKNLRASQIVEIMPVELKLTPPLIEFLKRLNRRVHNGTRNATVNEHKQSYRFLSTYNEWSELRQSKPACVNEESICSICSALFGENQRAVAVLPNGNVAHPGCLDVTTVRVNQRMV